MKDSSGGSIDYMRISITSRHNPRCRYCMPNRVGCLAHGGILILEEIGAVAICAARLGINHVGVTGEEPLVRRNCCQLVRMLKSIPGIKKVTIATSGVLLDRCLASLLEAGIDGVNISLGTLDLFLYKKITGFDCPGKVMETVELAVGQPIPVKINAVSIDFSSMDESGEPVAVSGGTDWEQIVGLTGRYPVNMRFIEVVPIGYGKQLETVNHKDLSEKMYREYPGLEEDHRQHGYGPAVYYRIPGTLNSVGLINAIRGKFCNNCNRVRLTSRGYLKTCLCYEDGTDLHATLRERMDIPGGESHYYWPLKDCPDDRVLQKCLSYAIRQVIERKLATHCFERPRQITEPHNMISIED